MLRGSGQELVTRLGRRELIWRTMEPDHDKQMVPKKGTKEKQSVFRVVIGEEANSKINEVLQSLNLGLEHGEVSRSDLANYVFLNLEKLLDRSHVEKIREAAFDELACLESMLKGATKFEDLPQEIQKALQKLSGSSKNSKKQTEITPKTFTERETP
jgi:hypothetical protein